MMEGKEPHSDSFLAQNDGFALEYSAPAPLDRTSLNTSLHTAVAGVFEWNGVETPSPTDSTQPIATTAFSGKKWQGAAHSANSLNYHSGGQGIRTLNRSPGN